MNAAHSLHLNCYLENVTSVYFQENYSWHVYISYTLLTGLQIAAWNIFEDSNSRAIVNPAAVHAPIKLLLFKCKQCI